MKTNDIESAWNGPERCRNCGIRHLVLFADLTLDDFKLVHEPIDEIEFAPGQMLYKAGAPASHVLTIRSGLVKLVQYLDDGSQRIVRLLKQGDVAGLEATADHEPAYQHDAVVLTPVTACRIPVAIVDRLSRETPRLHTQLMQRWQRAMTDADTWVTALSTGPARARVARLLMKLAEYFDGDTVYYPVREDIGAMLGITTETASRITADFTRRGLITKVSPGKIRLDVEALDSEVREA
ncbi:MAG: Crp/Fnr family transcriptional regulator [Pseudomonadota bacterium]|nr:Crp/Fnr family transcriptional regulator [Pseudomonadota bacterium]